MIWFYVSTCVLFSTIVGFHVVLAHLGETRTWNSHVIKSISRRKTILLKSKDEYSLINRELVYGHEFVLSHSLEAACACEYLRSDIKWFTWPRRIRYPWGGIGQKWYICLHSIPLMATKWGNDNHLFVFVWVHVYVTMNAFIRIRTIHNAYMLYLI